MDKDKTLAIRIAGSQKKALDDFAKTTGQSLSDVVNDSIAEYVNVRIRHSSMIARLPQDVKDLARDVKKYGMDDMTRGLIERLLDNAEEIHYLNNQLSNTGTKPDIDYTKALATLEGIAGEALHRVED